ncbi:MAG: S8/S53 family peptidase [Kineosporiaceae bacterium]|nr:S8/S53 family peptidase [Kineosporiaceae bacterium]
MADDRERDQIALILDTFRERYGEEVVVPYPPQWQETTVRHLYRRDTILTRASDAPLVERALAERQIENTRDDVDPPGDRDPAQQVLGLRVQTPPRYSEGEGLIDLVRELNADVGRRVVRPEHVLYVCGYPCPATEPEVPVGATLPTHRFPRPPRPCGCRGGGSHGCGAHGGPAADGWGRSVLIVDTGVDRPTTQAHSWTLDVHGDPDPAIANGRIGAYGGHGTFAAGCARVTAPRAEVTVSSALVPVAGAGFEREIAANVEAWLTKVAPDVLVFTFATATFEDAGLLAFDALYEHRLRHDRELAVLAPAGNDSWSTPMYPAAYPWVTAVGALDADCDLRADYSNHGPWVDLYAPGTDLVNTFATGDFTCSESPDAGQVRSFTGLARWSGTSFATPLVAGMVAGRASAESISAARALRHLRVEARLGAVPGVGPVLVP